MYDKQREQDSDNSINLRELILKYLVHWKWILLSIFISLVIAKLYIRYSVPVYRSSTTILIKEDKSGGLTSELSAFKDLDLFSGGKNEINDEIEVLKSRSIIGKAVISGEFNISYISEGRIKSSEIYADCPIKIDFKEKDDKFYKIDSVINVRVLSSKKFQLLDEENNLKGEYNFGELIKSKHFGSFVVNVEEKNLRRSNDKAVEQEVIKINILPIDVVIDNFRQNLGVAALVKYANIIEISYTNPVKKKAEDFLNRLVVIYNNDAIIDKNLISEKTAKFISERLGIITSELGEVEKESELYKTKNKITDIPTEAELYLNAEGDVKKSAAEISTQVKVVDIMIDFLRRNKESDIIPANIIPDDQSSNLLISEYNNLVIERNRILQSSTIDNPTVVRANEKITALKSSISESLLKLRSSLNIKSSEGNRQESILNSRISKLPKQEREFRGIYRQQQIKEELYLYLLKKREETAITLSATAPISKVVDYAYVSDIPLSPKRSQIYMIAFFLGILIPVLVIYLYYLLDTKVKTRADVEASLSIPFIGDVPHSDSHNEIIQPSSRSGTAEAIRIVRTNLEFILNSVEENKAKTIFLTSTLPKEGKTFIAINLAATIAISGKKVLLIGLDIRNPKLDEYVKLPSKGLTNFLSSNDADIKSFIVKQKGYEHFDILPAGIIPPNPAELLMSKKVDAMFNSLKLEYDYIVVDTAPVSLVTDTLLISKNADAFVYVVRSNYLEKALLKIPETFYQEKKLPNMCVLLNDTNSINGYGYGYGQEVVKKPWYKKIFSLTLFS
jgi:tyrosine-protein kinase Etk/Wzc